MTITFGWKSGSRHKINPQVAGERLEALREAHGGAVTPRIVVDDAADPKSPLHPEFEWDNAKAADEFRLEQGRSLLRSLVTVKTEDGGEEKRVRQYLVVTTPCADPEEEPAMVTAYHATDDALGNPQLRAQVLGRALAEARAFRRKYESLRELAGVMAAIDAVVAEPIVIAPNRKRTKTELLEAAE